MSEKRPTERDVVLRERAAFKRGFEHGKSYVSDDGDAAASSFFSLPKVTRPRVVKDNLGTRWRIVDGYVEWEARDGLWKRHSQSVEFLQNLATLLTSPTEEVDAEE